MLGGTTEGASALRHPIQPCFGITTSKSQTPVKRTCEGKPKQMPLLQVIITLIVVGILLWLVNRFIPMAPSIRSILNAVVVIAVVVWILNVFGLLAFLSNIHVGKPSP